MTALPYTVYFTLEKGKRQMIAKTFSLIDAIHMANFYPLSVVWNKNKIIYSHD